MSLVSRRHLSIALGLALGASVIAAGLPASDAAKAKRKAAPKRTAKVAAKAPKSKNATGKVAVFANMTLQLQSGHIFKLLPSTKVSISRGVVPEEEVKDAFYRGDTVVVTGDGKGNAISVKILPPARLAPGDYTVLGHTTYTPADAVVPLVWLRSEEKKRCLVQIDEDTQLTGQGVPEGSVGPDAIKQQLKAGSVVEVTLSEKAPTVDRYGEFDSPNCVNGLASKIEVLKPAEGGL